MKLNSLRITNFKNISSFISKKFGKINLIEGDTGQGKTAVLEAINLLLLNSLNSKVENYIKWGEKEFEVYGDWDLLDNNYKFFIIGDKKGFKRKLIINNDEENIYKNSDAVKKITEVINTKLSKYSCFSEQGEATKILFEGGSERLENFKVLFGIEKIAYIVENIKKDIDDNKEKINIKSGEISALKNREFNLEEIPDLPDIDIEEYQKKSKQLEIDREIFQEESLQNEKYLEQLKQHNEAAEQLDILNKNKEEEQKEIDSLLKDKKEEIDFDSKLLKKVEKEINEIEKEKIKLENDKKNFEDNVNKINDEKKRINNYKEKLSILSIKRLPRILFSEKDISILLENKNNKKLELSIVRKKIKSIENGKCPTCDTDFTRIDIKPFKEDETILNEEINKLDVEYTDAKKQCEDYKKIQQENKLNESQIDNIKENISIIKESISNLESKNILFDSEAYKKVDDKLIKFNKEKEELTRLKSEHDSFIKFNDDIDKYIKEINNIILEVNSKISVYEKIRKPREFQFTVSFDLQEHKKVQDTIIDYNSRLFEIKKIKESNEKIKKDRGRNAINTSILEDEVDELNSKNKLLDDCKKIVDKDFSAWVISKGSEFIKKKMNLFFQKAYSKYTITFQQSKKSIDFFYGYKDMIQSPVTMASGYEKEVLSIAFRVALSGMQNLGLMSLDEIDSFASDSKSLQLFNTLFNESNIDQYFIITHNESSKEMIRNEFNANIYELKDGELKNIV